MIRNFFAALILASAFVTTLVTPSAQAAVFGDPGTPCTTRFLTFPSWYNGLPRKDNTCEIDMVDVDKNGGGLATFIFRIVLNIIEIALQLVAYAAAGYIIYGGFKYLTSAGSADRVTAGRKIIQNALIGLIISFMSIAVVNLVAGNITSSSNPGKCAASANGQIDPDCVGVERVDAQSALNGILNTVYFAAGAASAIVIVISSIFYIISQGDASKTKRAKDGILYAIVGLVVVFSAFVITNFVIGRF